MPFLSLRIRTLLCLVLVCASWGSCYLFIELALRSFPPFLLAAIRIGIPGVLIWTFLRASGRREMPSWSDVRHAALSGFFMSVCSAGLMTLGQKTVPSGTVALMMGSMPLWMVLTGWLVVGEKRPAALQIAGLFLGSAGAMALGIRQGAMGAGSAFGMICIALNIAGWIAGSFISKRSACSGRLTVMQSTALMLMVGGLQLLAVSLLLGESCAWGSVNPEGWTSLFVLIMFGGVTAYACYFWLLANTGTAVAISYDYASPVVGLMLSHFVTGEEIGLFKAGACAVILTALTLVVAGERRGG